MMGEPVCAFEELDSIVSEGCTDIVTAVVLLDENEDDDVNSTVALASIDLVSVGIEGKAVPVA